MKSILVVDDERDLCDLISEQIACMGINVKGVYSAIDAFELIKKESFDAVITDIQMPQMDGIELMEKIKAEIKSPPLIIAITAFADYTKEDIMARGAVDLYLKPEGLVTLIEYIQNAIKKA